MKYNWLKFSRKQQLPPDDFRLKQIKGSDDITSYMAINRNYKNFDGKKEYPILLKLVFKQHTNIEESILSGMEFKFRNQMLSKGGLIFICRKEREDYRELLFYLPRKSLVKINAFDIFTQEVCIENLEILLSCDKNWAVAEGLLKYIDE